MKPCVRVHVCVRVRVCAIERERKGDNSPVSIESESKREPMLVCEYMCVCVYVCMCVRVFVRVIIRGVPIAGKGGYEESGVERAAVIGKFTAKDLALKRAFTISELKSPFSERVSLAVFQL